MQQPDVANVTQDVKRVVAGSEGELWRKHDISAVPALVGSSGSKLVGNEVFNWLRSRVNSHNINFDEVREASSRPKQFHRGNRRFAIVAIVIALSVWAYRSGLIEL